MIKFNQEEIEGFKKEIEKKGYCFICKSIKRKGEFRYLQERVDKIILNKNKIGIREGICLNCWDIKLKVIKWNKIHEAGHEFRKMKIEELQTRKEPPTNIEVAFVKRWEEMYG